MSANRENGAALIIVLVLLAILSILGAGLAGVVTGSARLFTDREQRTKAWYAAEAGVDFLVASLEYGLANGEDIETILEGILDEEKTVGDSTFRLSAVADRSDKKSNTRESGEWLAFQSTGWHGERQVTVDVLVNLKEKGKDNNGGGKNSNKVRYEITDVIWK